MRTHQESATVAARGPAAPVAFAVLLPASPRSPSARGAEQPKSPSRLQNSLRVATRAKGSPGLFGVMSPSGDTPVMELFCDDRRLRSTQEQSDSAVMQQLLQWTQHLLQRMHTATEAAGASAKAQLLERLGKLRDERAWSVLLLTAALCCCVPGPTLM
jgi:chemotaxis protein histidine kinase CheA